MTSGRGIKGRSPRSIPSPDLSRRERDRSRDSPGTDVGNWRVFAGAALIAALVLVAYWPALRGGFILDDDILVTANRLVQSSDGLYRMWFTTEPVDYWPVSNSTLWLEWRLWGTNPTGYHATNLVLHIGAALLVWAIAARLGFPGAFLAALLFALHPVNVESVAWIAQRKGVLAMVFFLASILFYLESERPPARPRASPPAVDRWYFLSLAAFVLAMLSKGSVAVLPVLLLAIVWWSRPIERRDLARTAPFFVVAAALVRVNMWFQTHGTHTEFRSAGPIERLLGAAAGVWFYLWKAIVPVDLVFVYPQWHIRADHVLWWLPLLAAIAATAALWWYRDGRIRPALLAWFWFCVSLIPVLGFTDTAFMEHSLVADHYQHLAIIGVLALVAAGWGVWRRRASASTRWAPTAAAIAMVAVLAVLTWRQSSLYADPVTLYEYTLERNPDTWLIHNDLGGKRFEAGRVPEAIAHFEDALRLNPDYPDAHSNIGLALLASGRLPEAIEHYERALRFNADHVNAHYNLGIALVQSGRLPEAIEHFRTALALKPDYASAYNEIGAALARTSHMPEAIDNFRQALRLQPDFPDAQFNLDLALKMSRESAEQR